MAEFLKPSKLASVLLFLALAFLYIQNKHENKRESLELKKSFMARLQEQETDGTLSLRDSIKNMSLDENDLIQSLEGFIARLQSAGYRKWYQGEMHLKMARFYIHSRMSEKAEEHLNQITYLNDPEHLLQPYIDKMLELIEQDEYERAMEILRHPELIQKRLNILDIYPEERQILEHAQTAVSWRYKDETKEMTDIEKQEFLKLKAMESYQKSHDVEPVYIEKNLCRLAAQGFAIKGRVDFIDDVKTIPACGDDNILTLINKDALSILVSNGFYKEAYSFLVKNKKSFWTTERNERIWPYFIRSRISKCLPITPSLPDSNAEALLQEKEALLQKDSPEDYQAHFLSLIFEQTGDYESAFDLANKIQDKTLRKTALAPIYNHYFMAGDRKKTLELLTVMETYEKAPFLNDNGWGTPVPDQWHVHPVYEARIFKEKPDTFSYDLAMKFTNPKTRFTALISLYYAFDPKDKPDGSEISSCETTFRSCIKSELVRIAEEENVPRDKDIMFYLLTGIGIEEENPEEAFSYFEQIKDTKKPLCIYDMCYGSMLPPRFLDFLMAQKNCQNYIPRLGEYMTNSLALYTKRKTDELDHRSKLLSLCHISSGVYETEVHNIDSPEIKSAYLRAVSDYLRKDGREEDVIKLLDLLQNTTTELKLDALGLDVILLKRYAEHPNVNRFDDDIERFKKLLFVLNNNTEYSQDSELWQAIADRLIQAEQVTLLREVTRLKPDLIDETEMLNEALYRLDNISEWISEYPPPSQIEKTNNTNQNYSYKKYISPLIEEGMYREAVYASVVLFEKESMQKKTLIDMLDKNYESRSWPYRLSQLKNRVRYRTLSGNTCLLANN